MKTERKFLEIWTVSHDKVRPVRLALHSVTKVSETEFTFKQKGVLTFRTIAEAQAWADQTRAGWPMLTAYF